jgi:HlyD family secretion protein
MAPRYDSLRAVSALLGVVLALAACSAGPRRTYQGYVEGEFVHVASSVGGRLEHLLVRRGQTVEANTPLFNLESTLESAAFQQANDTLGAARAELADLGTGKRAAEIEVVKAQLEQAKAAEKQSASALERNTAQFEAKGISRMQLDDSRTKHDVDAARVRELDAQLQVAGLSARPDRILAQNSQVEAARAAREQVKWRLDEKHVVAAQAGLVVDTLFREGEWVPAGSPVVRMLPPANVKVRFFVPEPSLSLFPIGGKVSVRCDGCPAALPATVGYVSTEPEYTPPIIYSNENRAKLVFMIEARPSPEDAHRLHPGQPLEVVPGE